VFVVSGPGLVLAADTGAVPRRAVRDRGLRILAKVGWVAVAVCTTSLATWGLGTGFLEFDPAANFAGDRRAQTMLTVSGFLFLALAVAAWFAFGGPMWSMLLLGGLAMACFVLSSTDLRFVAVPFLWPVVAAASVGVLARPAGEVA
jgi:hypothetical protein